jgi:hypothetical protein
MELITQQLLLQVQRVLGTDIKHPLYLLAHILGTAAVQDQAIRAKQAAHKATLSIQLHQPLPPRLQPQPQFQE